MTILTKNIILLTAFENRRFNKMNVFRLWDVSFLGIYNIFSADNQLFRI